MSAKYSSFKYGQFSKLLDDWLGADRNGDDGICVITDYNDSRICKFSLAGCCPFSLLQNTRLSRGQCRAEVCPAPQHLREAYQRDRANMTHPYDQNLYDILDQYLAAADKHIQFSKTLRDSRASEIQESPQLREMDRRIHALLDESRECGKNGDVIRARSLLDNAEIIKEQRLGKEQELMKTTMEADSKVTICEVCTAVIRQSDMEGRMAEHNVGRQHLAYMKMRETFETLKSAGIVGSRMKGRRAKPRTPSGATRMLQELD
jgi:hypothetical protein